jgi:ubiquinone/menaquinone biosynthesis C-methylase UbiE
MPRGTAAILERRSLEGSHRRLADMLRPGMRVLDAGCGTGAITSGIATAVRPHGLVVGVDRDIGQILRVGRTGGESFLRVVGGDVYSLPFLDSAFDVATASRVLQWLEAPDAALRELIRVTRSGGSVVVLDYNHERIEWMPPPPERAQRFYTAFLRWRAEAGMDNAIADRLTEMFGAAGLRDVQVTPQHETVLRGEAGFEDQIVLWADVAATRGRQMVVDGTMSEEQRAEAEAAWRIWGRVGATSQRLYLLAVEGRRP